MIQFFTYLRDGIEYIKGKPFVFLYILSFFYITPILLANVYYMDDYNRAVSGYGWGQDGRFVANAIMWTLNLKYEFFKIKQTDFFPYTIILSAFVLIVSGVILCGKLNLCNKNSFTLLPSFLLFSPFMLENITYRYDSFIMTISILWICIPFLFIKKTKIFIFSSFLFLFFTWMTYQSTVSGYIALCCIFSIDYLLKKENKKAYSILMSGACTFLVSAIFYRFLIKVFHVNILFGRSMTIFQTHNVAGEFIFNLRNGFVFISDNLDSRFFTACAPLFLIFIYSMFHIAKKSLKSKNDCFTFFYVIILFSIVLLCTLGLNVFIYTPPWWLRILISFPFVFLAMIVISKNYVKLSYMNFSCAFLLLYVFGLCATYASSLKQQNNFTDQILAVANPYLLSDDHMKLVIDGEIPYAPQVEFAKSNYTIIGTLVDKYMKNDWYWGERRAGIYNIVDDVFISGREREDIISKKCSYHLETKNKFFILRSNHDISIIDFKKDICK